MFEQVWSIWIKFKQFDLVRSSLDMFEQVWSSLNKFDQFGSSLNQFDQGLLILIKFEQVWTNNSWKSRQNNTNLKKRDERADSTQCR